MSTVRYQHGSMLTCYTRLVRKCVLIASNRQVFRMGAALSRRMKDLRRNETFETVELISIYGILGLQ
jgi:hypothetical protein